MTFSDFLLFLLVVLLFCLFILQSITDAVNQAQNEHLRFKERSNWIAENDRRLKETTEMLLATRRKLDHLESIADQMYQGIACPNNYINYLMQQFPPMFQCDGDEEDFKELIGTHDLLVKTVTDIERQADGLTTLLEGFNLEVKRLVVNSATKKVKASPFKNFVSASKIYFKRLINCKNLNL